MSKTLTAEIMADINVPSGVQISPDGSQVVVSVGTNTREGDHREAAIWLIDTGNPESARQITAGTVNDTAPRWTPDGNSISFLSDRDKRGTSQIYLLPLSDGGEARRLTDEAGGVSNHAWLRGEGNRIAYLSPDARDEDEEKRRKEERDDAKVWGAFWPFARLHILDLDSGETSKIDLGERHVSGMSPSPDGAKIAVTTSESPELESIATTCELAIVDVASGNIESICAPDRMLGSLIWNADGSTIFADASAGPVPAVSSNQLWRVAAQAGAKPELLTADLHGCVRGLARGGADGTLYGVVQVGVETDIFAFDEATDEFQPVRHFSGDLAELSISDDGSVAATLGSTINRPFDVYSVDLSSDGDGSSFAQLTDLHTLPRRHRVWAA